MANDKVFTMPLVASNSYELEDATGAKGITIVNDSTSTNNIDITGTLSVIISGSLVASSAISLAPSESITVTSDTPLNLTIDVGAATTGKMILVI